MNVQGETAVWFDGQEGAKADWIYGKLSNIIEKPTSGYLVSDEDTTCPNYVSHWKEWSYRDQSWSINYFANVQCADDMPDDYSSIRGIDYMTMS